MTARNFNPMMATAGRCTLAEVEVTGRDRRDRSRRRGHAGDLRATTSSRGRTMKSVSSKERLVLRAAQELHDGYYVNLGIGMPTLIANHVPPGMTITFQSENGLLGIGPFPLRRRGGRRPHQRRQADGDRAAGRLVLQLRRFLRHDPRRARRPDASSARMEVDERGNLANWMIPGKMVKGMGGAMDLVAGARRVVVIMNHASKDGDAKIVNRCSLPLTGVKVVHRIITETGGHRRDAGGPRAGGARRRVQRGGYRRRPPSPSSIVEGARFQ